MDFRRIRGNCAIHELLQLEINLKRVFVPKIEVYLLELLWDKYIIQGNF